MSAPARALKSFQNHPLKILSVLPYGEGAEHSQKPAETFKEGPCEETISWYFCVLLWPLCAFDIPPTTPA